MIEEINKLYHDIDIAEFRDVLDSVDRETWNRWLLHKNEYYNMCRKQIRFAVAHYARQTPIPPEDIEGHANMFFCIACLRWDPEKEASLPTYVANQLRRLGGYLVRPEARHKNQFSTIVTDKGPQDALSLIGTDDPDNTVIEYVRRAGQDAADLYDALASGRYQRTSKGGNSKSITAVGLYRSKAFPWKNLARYENALKALKAALDAWAYGKSFIGFAKLASAVA